MKDSKDLFAEAEAVRIAEARAEREQRERSASAGTLPALPAALSPDNHGPELLTPPDCHCCEQAECENELQIECAECGETFARGHDHECAQNPSTPGTLLAEDRRLKRVERAAWKAVRHWGDSGGDDAFAEMMIDLARVLAQGE